MAKVNLSWARSTWAEQGQQNLLNTTQAQPELSKVNLSWARSTWAEQGQPEFSSIKLNPSSAKFAQHNPS